MQPIKYASTAWNDIKNSPGWFGKIALLALLQLIPIFGQIVLFGYAYGWARDIAWSVHRPMPAKIFGNEDGKLYSRGFFLLVIYFVFMLVPSLVFSILASIFGAGVSYSMYSGSYSGAGGAIAGYSVVVILEIAVTLFVLILFGVAAMRTSIYDRIAAGFQLKKVWAMLRHDSSGALRIFGMAVAITAVTGLVLTVILTIFILLGVGSMIPGFMAFDSYYYEPSPGEVLGLIGPALGIFLLAFTAVGFFGSIMSVFTVLMVARASGYWTQQFDVTQWRGMEDPMPFEVAAAQAQAQQAQYAAQVQYAQAQAQYAQAQGAQISYQDQQAQAQYAQAQAASQAAAQPQAAVASQAAQASEAVQPLDAFQAAQFAEAAQPLEASQAAPAANAALSPAEAAAAAQPPASAEAPQEGASAFDALQNLQQSLETPPAAQPPADADSANPQDAPQ